MSGEFGRNGSAFLVNSKIANSQESPRITGLANGGFVLTWSDQLTARGDSVDFDVKGQIFDVAGAAVGGEFRVNTQMRGAQFNGDVVALASGGFVVIWQDHGGTLGDVSGASIKGQIYAANGGKIGEEFLVNTMTQGDQWLPRVADLSDGGFVVSWADSNPVTSDLGGDIKAQRFDATGGRIGQETLVNSQIYSIQTTPDVAGLTGGGYVVTWWDVYLSDVKAQIFDRFGAKVGGEFQVNSQFSSSQHLPSVTGLSNGGFVLSWQDDSGTFGDGDGSSVKAQVFTAAGGRVGGEILVNTQIHGNQNDPEVAALADGAFVITWTDASVEGDGSGTSIKAQRFDALGAHIGDEFLVNTTTSSDQVSPVVASTGQDGFVIAWQSGASAYGDKSDWGILAQRFAPGGILSDTSGDDILTSTAGNDIMEGGAGTDTAVYTEAAKAVRVNLSITDTQNTGGHGKDTLVSIENLIGSAFNDTLTGNGVANRISGGAGNDKLSGGAGNDRLLGGAGKDTLTGGSGADTFLFDTLETSKNADTIKDFATGIDHIELAISAFGALSSYGSGGISTNELTLGKAATHADQHLIYNSGTGALYYDADGFGGAAQVLIASLGKGVLLAASDIILI